MKHNNFERSTIC